MSYSYIKNNTQYISYIPDKQYQLEIKWYYKNNNNLFTKLPKCPVCNISRTETLCIFCDKHKTEYFYRIEIKNICFINIIINKIIDSGKYYYFIGKYSIDNVYNPVYKHIISYMIYRAIVILNHKSYTKKSYFTSYESLIYRIYHLCIITINLYMLYILHIQKNEKNAEIEFMCNVLDELKINIDFDYCYIIQLTEILEDIHIDPISINLVNLTNIYGCSSITLDKL